MPYNFNTHAHIYAVWTAARAAQRGFTTTKIIEEAINKTELEKYTQEPTSSLTNESFDEFHRKTAKVLMEALKTALKTDKEKAKVTYGRAAKIISIYIKTAYILTNKGSGELSRIAHPPVDAILLESIHKDKKNNNKHLGLKEYRWTKLNEEEYFEVIEKLRTLDCDYFWELERYWKPK